MVGTILKDQLVRLADLVEIHILTADKRAKSSDCFGALPVHVRILAGDDQDVQKRRYLNDFALPMWQHSEMETMTACCLTR